MRVGELAQGGPSASGCREGFPDDVGVALALLIRGHEIGVLTYPSRLPFHRA
jgi:hypothetical protein